MATHENEAYSQPTSAPTTKVTAFTVGAATATIIVSLVNTIWDVQLQAGFEGALATLVGFVIAYFTKERPAL